MRQSAQRIYVARDYLIDHMFWRFGRTFVDRLEAAKPTRSHTPQYCSASGCSVEEAERGPSALLRPIADDMPPLRVVLARHSTAQLTSRAAAFARFCHAMFQRDAASRALCGVTGHRKV